MHYIYNILVHEKEVQELVLVHPNAPTIDYTGVQNGFGCMMEQFTFLLELYHVSTSRFDVPSMNRFFCETCLKSASDLTLVASACMNSHHYV